MPIWLLDEFDALGLSPYEARVVAGLLRLGSANTLQLSASSGVPRTSLYQVLEGLRRKGLAHRIPGDGPATWSTPGHAEILDRLAEALAASHEEQRRQHRARSDRLRRELDDMSLETPAPSLPYVHIIDGAAKVKATYDGLLGRATAEVLMFTRPPYSYVLGQPNRAVLDALARGVHIRVLYEEEQMETPSEAGFPAEMDAYHRAGVHARVVDELPMKLVVVDRADALIAMQDPVQPEEGFPTTVLVEHPGFAGLQAGAFERLWEASRPLPTSAQSQLLTPAVAPLTVPAGHDVGPAGGGHPR